MTSSIVPYQTPITNQYADYCWQFKRTNVYHAWKQLQQEGINTKGIPQIAVCVVDSGLDHQQYLPSLVWPDWCYNGQDASTNIYDSSSLDNQTDPAAAYSHGTNCYSILKSNANSSVGIPGIVPDSFGMFGAVTNMYTNTAAAITAATDYAVANNKKLIFSLSFSTAYGTGLSDAIAYAISHGALIYACSGNEMNLHYTGTNILNGGQSYLPQTIPGIAIVGGAGGPSPHVYDTPLNQGDIEDGDSNLYPAWGVGIEIVGPGHDVVVCGSADRVDFSYPSYEWGGWGEVGRITTSSPQLNHHISTSYSTPIVAGCAALVWAVNPNLQASDVRDILNSTALPGDNPNWSTQYPNAGMVNAGKAVAKARATLSKNAGIPIPYIGMYGANVVTTVDPIHSTVTTIVNGSFNLDISGFCDQAITSIDVLLGSQLVYSGPPIILKATGTTGTNTVTVVARTAANSTSETYSDITFGTLTLPSVYTPYYCSGVHNSRINDQWGLFRANAFHAWKYTTGDPSIKAALVCSFGILNSDTNITVPPPERRYNIAWDNPLTNTDYKHALDNAADVFCGTAGPGDAHDGFCFEILSGLHGTNPLRGLAPNCTWYVVSCSWQYGGGGGVSSTFADILLPDQPSWQNGVAEALIFKKASEFGARVMSCSEGTAFTPLYGYIDHNGNTVPNSPDVLALLDDIYNTMESNGAISFLAEGDTFDNSTTLQVPYNYLTGQFGGAVYPIKFPAVVPTSAIDNHDNTTEEYGPEIVAVAPGNHMLLGAGAGMDVCWSGTSFASPFATGITALVLSINPLLTTVGLRNIATIYGVDVSPNPTFKTLFPNAGIINAGKCVSIARATAPANANIPIPYIGFQSPATNTMTDTTAVGANPYLTQGVHTSVDTVAGTVTTNLSGSNIIIDLNGYCNFNPITGHNDVTSVELWIGNTRLYSGVPRQFYGVTATAGNNHVTVVANTATASYSETYTDINVGALIIPPDVPSCTLAVTSVVCSLANILFSNISVPALRTITGYMVTTTNTQPSPTDSGWLAAPPTTYVYTGSLPATITLYGWVQDSANAVSVLGTGVPVNFTSDTTKPSIDSFTCHATPGYGIQIDAFTAHDNVQVVAYALITNVALAPSSYIMGNTLAQTLAKAPVAGVFSGWQSTPPTTFQCNSGSAIMLTPMVLDEANNQTYSNSTQVILIGGATTTTQPPGTTTQPPGTTTQPPGTTTQPPATTTTKAPTTTQTPGSTTTTKPPATTQPSSSTTTTTRSPGDSSSLFSLNAFGTKFIFNNNPNGAFRVMTSYGVMGFALDNGPPTAVRVNTPFGVMNLTLAGIATGTSVTTSTTTQAPSSVTTAPIGGMIMGGTSSITQSMIMTSQGGMVLGGVSIINQAVNTPSLGGMILGGTSATTQGMSVSSLGGMVLGGGLKALQGYNIKPQGGMVLGGNLTTITTVGGGNITSLGGMVMGGTSPVTIGASWTSVGGMVMGGTCQAFVGANYNSIGGMIMGGSLLASLGISLNSSGGIVMGGICTATQGRNMTSQGGMIMGGNLSQWYFVNTTTTTSTTNAVTTTTVAPTGTLVPANPGFESANNFATQATTYNTRGYSGVVMKVTASGANWAYTQTGGTVPAFSNYMNTTGGKVTFSGFANPTNNGEFTVISVVNNALTVTANGNVAETGATATVRPYNTWLISNSTTKRLANTELKGSYVGVVEALGNNDGYTGYPDTEYLQYAFSKAQIDAVATPTITFDMKVKAIGSISDTDGAGILITAYSATDASLGSISCKLWGINTPYGAWTDATTLGSIIGTPNLTNNYLFAKSNGKQLTLNIKQKVTNAGITWANVDYVTLQFFAYSDGWNAMDVKYYIDNFDQQ